MPTNYSIRYAIHPEDFTSYGTQKLRDEFLLDALFTSGDINLVYTHYDRYIVGGAMPGRQNNCRTQQGCTAPVRWLTPNVH